MKVMLVFPPHFDATMPNLSLPCLAAVLRRAGHEVILKDANVESYDHFLTEDELRRALELMCERRPYFIFSGTPQMELERLVNKRNILFRSVERAKNTLRDKNAFYDFREYAESINTLNDCLKFLSLAYYRTELALGFFRTNYSHESTDQIMKAVQDKISNPYIDYYTRFTMADIEKASPSVVGISISASSQMIPGLTLAYMIKKAHKDVHIVVGGNHMTCLKDKLLDNHRLFSLFDSVILHEGETALLRLVESLEGGKTLEQVPNLIYRNENGEIKANTSIHTEDVDELPTPDFNGLPLEMYLSPELLLPIYSCRGCYWGKCTFCNFKKTSGLQYRVRDVKLVLEDMKKLAVESRSNNFIFVDEAVSPKYFGMLSEELINKGMKVNWLSNARFDKEMGKGLCEKLASSGCKMLAFGLESASGRVLAKMNKGTDVRIMKDTLIASSNAGIANHVCFILGFPTEIPAEAMETVHFILDHIEHISSMISSNFSLLSNSFVYHQKEAYGVEVIPPRGGHDLASSYSYQVKSGLTQKVALTASQRFIDEMSRLIYPFYSYADFFNYHAFLYAKKYNTNRLTGVLEKSLDINKETIMMEIKRNMEEILNREHTP